MMQLDINGIRWTLGNTPIGEGGSGQVFLAYAEGEDDAEHVIKLVPKAKGSKRELLFADDLKELSGIIPVLGVGETDSHHALLMPKAQYPLRKYIDFQVKSGGGVEDKDAYPILADIAQTLVRLADRGIVHRDLKPDNILRYNGAWCLSDFGISRYTEATTDSQTLMRHMTPYYAAPEQWRRERVTPAADVYALGILCHEMLSGRRPFNGPDFSHQHLNEAPPPLTGVPPLLAALIADMLAKRPETRPRAADVLAQLHSQSQPVAGSVPIKELGEAILAEARRREAASAAASWRVSEEARRADLADTAETRLANIRDRIIDRMAEESGGRAFRFTEEMQAGHRLDLGPASLRVSSPRRPGIDDLARFTLPFDLICHAEISVTFPPKYPRLDFQGRSHSLLFLGTGTPGSYGWYEVAFLPKKATPRGEMFYAFARGRSDLYRPDYMPFALTTMASSFVGEKELAALASVFTESASQFLIIWPLTKVPPWAVDEFAGRWIKWLAQASTGTLMPATPPPTPSPREEEPEPACSQETPGPPPWEAQAEPIAIAPSHTSPHFDNEYRSQTSPPSRRRDPYYTKIAAWTISGVGALMVAQPFVETVNRWSSGGDGTSATGVASVVALGLYLYGGLAAIAVVVLMKERKRPPG